jgi:hypothetical protein
LLTPRIRSLLYACAAKAASTEEMVDQVFVLIQAGPEQSFGEDQKNVKTIHRIHTSAGNAGILTGFCFSFWDGEGYCS